MCMYTYTHRVLLQEVHQDDAQDSVAIKSIVDEAWLSIGWML